MSKFKTEGFLLGDNYTQENISLKNNKKIIYDKISFSIQNEESYKDFSCTDFEITSEPCRLSEDYFTVKIHRDGKLIFKKYGSKVYIAENGNMVIAGGVVVINKVLYMTAKCILVKKIKDGVVIIKCSDEYFWEYFYLSPLKKMTKLEAVVESIENSLELVSNDYLISKKCDKKTIYKFLDGEIISAKEVINVELIEVAGVKYYTK